MCDVKLCINSVPFLLLQSSVFAAALVYFQFNVKTSWLPCFHVRETKRAWIGSSRKRDTLQRSTLLCLLLTLKFHLPSSTTKLHMCRNRCTFKVWGWAGASVQLVIYFQMKNSCQRSNQLLRADLEISKVVVQDLFEVNRCQINFDSELCCYRSYIFQADFLD